MSYFVTCCRVLLILTSLIAPSSFAQIFGKVPVTGNTNQTFNNFDYRFIRFVKRWRVPGASVTVAKNGQIILSRGYGWADTENRQPVQPNSLFRVGSVSKAITAVTVLKLIQEQKLNFDDKAFQVLDNFTPLNNRINPQIYAITIRNLLQMSSGWYTNKIDPMFGPWTGSMVQVLAHDIPPDCITAVRLMMGRRFQYKPGTRYSYSNLNYCMLGLITNRVTGTPYGYQGYQNYVRESILAPLGITTMQIGDTLPQNRLPNEVKYYRYLGVSAETNNIVSDMAMIDGLPYSNSQILKKNFADGGWVASSQDLTKLLMALDNHQILTPRMFSIMMQRPTFQRQRDNYFAMGWTVRHINGHTYWTKTGSFTGTVALIMLRDDGTAYAALFNIKPSPRVQFFNQLRQLLISV